MKIVFLGTGTSGGVPMIGCDCVVCHSPDKRDKRLRASILMEINRVSIVIDTGPDFRYQMLRENVKRVDGILMTHSHKDHIAGLDDIRAFNFFMRQSIPVWASPDTEKALRREYAYAFETPQYPGVPQMDIHPFDNATFKACGIEVTPVRTLHARMEVYGFRIGGFVYITDANRIPEEEFSKLQNAEVLVLNALRTEQHPSHFTLEEAIEIGKRSGARTVYFTHMSHQMGLHEAMEKTLPENMHFAYDGLTLNL